MGEGHTRLTQVQRFERAKRLRDVMPQDDVSPGTLVTAFALGTAVLLTAAATADLSP